MRKDVVFRGCTRPPMFMGVPYVPFTIAGGSCLLLAFYIHPYFVVLLPVVVLVMRQMARRDEMIFRLLGLRLRFRMKVRNRAYHRGMWVFSPNSYRKEFHKDACP
ncbi:type IV secretion system protein VirB3 [Luteimonas wenzhouensis]|jgi:type IV secretion system protein VirB3|uniref:Type IV secretion system protein VirB3 n=1 Tax=Luteimonas wenzhouensis TaxID=2599615 RepID=A0A5C5TX16_9GAMM|nr:VirB3 family type IV secretion system protein [Luteimonas wenzhouensis]NLW95299.1 hypothetical protein [Xanthomonadaceae bacterium]TWT17680.1 hypothetical protein FQY79_12540 [Luteimonas wenzhouensis]